MHRVLWLTLLLLGSLLSPALAAEDCAIPPSARLSPPTTDAPVPVAVGLVLTDVIGIDDETQSVDLDAFSKVSWQDPRLAAFAGCRVSPAAIWNPGVEIVNTSKLRNQAPPTAFILEGGQVVISRRFTGWVTSPHRLQDFPFDKRSILLQLVPREAQSDTVVLEVDPTFTARKQDFSIADWAVGEPTVGIDEWNVLNLGQTRSRLNFEVPAQRLRGYWVFKVMLPLLMIIAMSWAVFWIDAAHFATAIGLAATSMLTLIAFQFSVANTLPRVSYLTIMDEFVFGAAVLVFLALVEAVVTSALVGAGKGDLARRMDYAGRFVLPLALLTLVAWITWQAAQAS